MPKNFSIYLLVGDPEYDMALFTVPASNYSSISK